MRAPWDWPPEGNWPPRPRPTIEYEQNRRGTYIPRRRRPPLGFGLSLLIVAVAALLVLRFMWPALLMGAVLLGIDTPGEMATVLVVVVLIAAAALRQRLNGRRF